MKLDVNPIITVDRDNVIGSYCGGHGCMCGCRGSYSKTIKVAQRAFDRVVTSGLKIEVDEDNTCIIAKSATRMTVIYFKAFGKAFKVQQ